MSGLLVSGPCLCFALRRESAPFRRQLRACQRYPGAPCAAWVCELSGMPVLLMETGVGTSLSETALEWVQAQATPERISNRPRLILATGFAGALHEGLRAGDILVADEVIDPAGNRWPATWPGELPPKAGCPPLHRGRLLTMPQLVATPQQKRSLAQQYDAVAVDMESAAVARFCQRWGVPFGCLRAISDNLATPLSPRLVALLDGGRVSPVRVLAALGASPCLAGELWRLARHTRVAADQLAQALGALLRHTFSTSVATIRP